MNMFQFAVASIVDANTGNGLIHSSSTRDYFALEQHGRKIRAKSIAGLFKAIGSNIGAAVDSYRARAKQARDFHALMQLNDHLLEDIGLTRGDLYAVQLGSASLEELSVSRGSGRRQDQVGRGKSSAVDSVSHELDAVNEQFYDQKKCA